MRSARDPTSAACGVLATRGIVWADRPTRRRRPASSCHAVLAAALAVTWLAMARRPGAGALAACAGRRARHGEAVILRVERLTVRRGGRTVIDELELAAAPGELVGIVGKNGCGKSTLVLAIAGVLAPTDGRIAIDGASVWGASRERSRARRAARLRPRGRGSAGVLAGRRAVVAVRRRARCSPPSPSSTTGSGSRAARRRARSDVAGPAPARVPRGRPDRPGRSCSCSTSRQRPRREAARRARELLQAQAAAASPP